MTTIETDRLVLRGWKAEDFEAYRDYYADAENARFVGGRQRPDDAWRRLATEIGHWELNGFGRWAVVEKETGSLVGSIGLWKSAEWPELELSYWVRPEHRGKGYAREACVRSRDHARDELGAESLVSYIHPDNTASIRLAEALGAEYEKTIELLAYGPHRVHRHF